MQRCSQSEKEDGDQALPRMTYRQHTGITTRGLWLALCNVVLAIQSGLFAYAHGLNFLQFYRPSSFLIMAKQSLDALFFFARRAPFRTSRSPYDWIVGIAGLSLPLLLRPVDRPFDFVIGQFLQFAGFFLQIIGIISLNRSFGIVAANRGVKTGGLYRFVRHPLYSAYIIGDVGYLTNNLSIRNIVIFILSTMLQLLRISVEENFLRQDAAYVEYAKRTRWRLVPFVF